MTCPPARRPAGACGASAERVVDRPEFEELADAFYAVLPAVAAALHAAVGAAVFVTYPLIVKVPLMVAYLRVVSVS
jgi:hypothetical protein